MGNGASKKKGTKTKGRHRRLSVTEQGAAAAGSPDGTPGDRGGGGASGTDGMNENGSKTIAGKTLRYATLSQAGYEPDHVKKENQDNYLVGLKDDPNHMFFGVFDGHGGSGHFVSAFVVREMPKCMPLDLLQKEVSDIAPALKFLETTFAGVASGLLKQRAIDITLSGSTAVSVLVRGRHLISANLGDSRAVIGREEGGQLVAVPMSNDQKPERADEKRRILKAGGRVEPLFDESGGPIGPARVWLSNLMMPGLAMTRSFGDQVAESVGVHAIPELMDRALDDDDKFLILASDGVWEFISNERAVAIVAKCNGDPVMACRELVRESYEEWIREEEVVDDITAVVIFFS